MDQEKRGQFLPFGGQLLLQQAVDTACRAQNCDFSHEGDARFEEAFAEGLKRLIEQYGLRATVRSFCSCEEVIGMPCGSAFLTEQEVSLPFHVNDTDRTVDTSILTYGSNIRDYIAGNGSLADKCWLCLIEDVYVHIPAWEAADVIVRYRDEIERERRQVANGGDELDLE